MARADDYRRAYEIAKEELQNRNPHHVCRASGAQCIEKGKQVTGIRLRFLNRPVTIDWPDVAFHQESREEIPIKQKILVLHYLNGSSSEDLTGDWISYKDIPSARFYLDAFNRRVKYPLVTAFGEHPDRLPPIAKELYGATTSSLGDISVEVQAFPKVPITLLIWRGDEEFPSDGTILFDSSIKDILSAEDISELTSQVVYPMIEKAK
ncbi:MAG: hypothetical protein DRG87_09525 [Deltaproteobacteria bacterium]|nr:DUF3786 domain-containing protein [Deltaproteobacteria bacterium]MBW2078342.1 DUF3786 domain-containing protein [Deltaproteobacteria bacterium]MBW2309616.1 DUF3786 domain-containing protein [Deltaproteobacteria bacterium]RLB28346.1 MAG: hypothetical protein DRG87_09525 [Deltaproteobacteria bacterium]